ncbi:MAG: glutathione S-transferase family protein [Deltaproteobacteria bacterium]|nr:glutathione S-transferase family protein [Deltaproteobacteria bacterium]
MSARVRIVGSYLSPYVRKVLVCLHMKGVPYEIDPIIPFMGDDRFSKLSPLRRIPVLIDADVTLSDSTVICEYLEERHPEPALYPRGVAERARARWLEEFADTRMGEVFIWRLFNQAVINPFVWRKKTDTAILNRTLTEEIPHVLDYLEGELPAEGYIFGDPTVADIAIASFFRNARFAGFRVDTERWPRTAAFVDRTLGLAGFQAVKFFEDRLIRTPLAKHRTALAEIGAPLTEDTYGTPAPRRGMMQT